MEENISQNIPPAPPAIPTPLVTKPPFGSWWKVGVLVVGILLAASILYASVKYSQKQSPLVSSPTVTPTPFPTPPSPPPTTQITPFPSGETANWEIYTSNEGNFSIQYPPDYKLNINEIAYVDGVKSPAKSTIQILSGGDEDFSLIITFKDVEPDMSLIEHIQKEDPWLKVETKKPYLLNNKEALLFEDESQGAYGPVTLIYALNGNKLYNFYIESHSDFANIKNYINQILSTFKFLD